MAKLPVVWTQTAVRQRQHILSYWHTRNQSVEYPRKLIRVISRRVEQIATHPLGFPSVDYPNTRACSLGHYSIFYQVQADRIIITAFWDNRQDPKKLLETLKS